MNFDSFPDPEGGMSKVLTKSLGYRQVGFIIGLPEITRYKDGRKKLIHLLTQSLPSFDNKQGNPFLGPVLTDSIKIKGGFMTEILLSPIYIDRDKLIDPRKAFDLLSKEYGNRIHLTLRMPRE